MRLILLGPPGAGKGTQAQMLCETLKVPPVSTGNILKQAIRDGTPLGLEAAGAISAGRLVPDDVVIGIVRERIGRPDCAEGFVLDGFPRTTAQALALEEMGVRIDAAVNIAVSDESIVRRVGGRRSCPVCGRTYHTDYVRPKEEGRCDSCHARLVLRPDDRPEAVSARLEAYRKETRPLEDFYARRGLLREVDGETSVGEVSRQIKEALGI